MWSACLPYHIKPQTAYKTNLTAYQIAKSILTTAVFGPSRCWGIAMTCVCVCVGIWKKSRTGTSTRQSQEMSIRYAKHQHQSTKEKEKEKEYHSSKSSFRLIKHQESYQGAENALNRDPGSKAYSTRPVVAAASTRFPGSSGGVFPFIGGVFPLHDVD